jgi:O-antigen/teichoic acid export membrane protein
MLNFAGKVIRGSTLRAFYFIATVVVSFVLTPVILRYLGDRMYGFWSLVVVIIGYYGLLDLGLSTAVSRFVSRALGARNDEDLYNIYNTAFMFFSIIGLVVILVTAIIIIFTPFLNLNIASDDMILFKRVILVMGLDVAFSFPVRLFRGVLYSQLHYDIMSGLALLTLVLRTPLIVIVLMAGHGVLAMAIVTVLTKLPEYGLTIFISRKTLPHIRLSLQGWDPETAKMLFSFALYAFIAQLANILRFQIDPVVLASFMSLVMVAHYRIGSLIANHFLNFMIETMSVLQPVFSRLEGANEDQGIMRTLFFSTKISVYVSTFMCFGLIFWGKPFIELWVGPEYLDAYPVLFFLVLGFVFILWQAPSASLLMGTSITDKHRSGETLRFDRRSFWYFHTLGRNQAFCTTVIYVPCIINFVY